MRIKSKQDHYLCFKLEKIDEGGITGETPTIVVRRVVDGFYFDFDAGELDFKNSAWVQKEGDLTEVNATDEPGVYDITLPCNDWDNGLYVINCSTNSYPGFETDELWIGDDIDDWDALTGNILVDKLNLTETRYRKDGVTILAEYDLTKTKTESSRTKI